MHSFYFWCTTNINVYFTLIVNNCHKILNTAYFVSENDTNRSKKVSLIFMSSSVRFAWGVEANVSTISSPWPTPRIHQAGRPNNQWHRPPTIRFNENGSISLLKWSEWLSKFKYEHEYGTINVFQPRLLINIDFYLVNNVRRLKYL